MTSKGFLKGGIREVMVKLAMIIMKRMTKAVILIAQPKPTSGISFCTMMGSMTPPKELPPAMIPNANARFLKNLITVSFSIFPRRVRSSPRSPCSDGAHSRVENRARSYAGNETLRENESRLVSNDRDSRLRSDTTY